MKPVWISPPLPLKAAVPQGAALSANLSLIIINDLLNLPSHGNINDSADNIAILYFNNNINIMIKHICMI